MGTVNGTYGPMVMLFLFDRKFRAMLGCCDMLFKRHKQGREVQLPGLGLGTVRAGFGGPERQKLCHGGIRE